MEPHPTHMSGTPTALPTPHQHHRVRPVRRVGQRLTPTPSGLTLGGDVPSCRTLIADLILATELMGEDVVAETAALADLADGLDVVHGGELGVGEAEPVALGAGMSE